eukprot:4996874-Pleurochrysis_carterae.AAC.1
MTDRFNADNAHPSQYCNGITDAATSRTHVLICTSRTAFATLEATALRHTALTVCRFKQQPTA